MDLTKQEKISVLAVNYNQKQELNTLISSLNEFLVGLNYEVIIFDNSSNFLPKTNVKVFSIGKNIGYGTAIDYLATKATGKHFLIINPDVVFKGALKPSFISYLNSDLKTVVLSLGKGEKQYTLPFLVRFQNKKRFSGFAFLIAKHAFKQLGGFESSYFMYFEDDDLNLKLEKFGLKTLYLQKPLAVHKKTYKNENFKKRKKYYYDSQLIFLKRNHKLAYFFFYIPSKILSLISSA